MEDQNQSEDRLSLFDRLISTGLGSGLSPFAPGTVGSIVGVVIYLIPGFERVYVILPAIVVVFLAGARAAGKTERKYGHDPSRVVVDEIVGMWLSLVLLPKKAVVVIAAFLVFRILDIFKPFPANYFDRRNGGFAVMADDAVCGIYSNILIQILIRIF